MLSPDLQLALREHPLQRAAMLQKWRDLTFLHYSVEPEVVQALLPEGLTVDTFDGRAWVGLVPFWMTGIRFPWFFAVPGTHTFPETNVRTYVHQEGKDPGVWFFSLDASNALAVRWARRFFSLPYHLSRMHVEQGETIRYSCRRADAHHEIETRVGKEMDVPRPGSLEFFLIERYLLYALKNGRLYKGLVHHYPYALHEAEILRCEESMLAANGLPSLPWEHICYSPGVDVRVCAIG